MALASIHNWWRKCILVARVWTVLLAFTIVVRLLRERCTLPGVPHIARFVRFLGDWYHWLPCQLLGCASTIQRDSYRLIVRTPSPRLKLRLGLGRIEEQRVIYI